MKTLNFQKRFRISVPIEMTVCTLIINHPVFTAFNRKFGGKCIGSYRTLEKWPIICCILILNFKLDNGGGKPIPREDTNIRINLVKF